MQPKGQRHEEGNRGSWMRATDDEIREKYLERAIREINSLAHDIQDCALCPRGNLMPVLGSGHPQADIMLLKFAPQPSEIEEGVAFYGRSGTALMKSFKRLGIDPLVVYGTLFVKCPVPDTEMSAPECRARVADEIAIVQPRIIVAMGAEAVEELNALALPLARPVAAEVGSVQKFTPTIDVLYVPNIDSALDEESAKRDFWTAFRVLGDWYSELPPY
jgi:uracil-DNA glycosylase